jgi:acetate kinase
MIIVTVNSGSTSVKLAAFRSAAAGDAVRIAHEQHSDSSLQPAEVLRRFLAGLKVIPDAVAHRVVHGGTRFKGPTPIDEQALQAIRQLSQLAPLHNPKALEWIEAARQITGAAAAQVAAFDTSFFCTLPRVAAEYALDARFGVDQGVRRYGFHGLAHEALWRRWSKLHPSLSQGGRVITLQLGGGCSAAAIAGGRPLDTTMGFSPLEGLVMATRCGDIDPAVVPYLQGRLGLSSDEVLEHLNRESGVAGLAGGVTDLGRLAADPSTQAQFAVDLYCYRVRKCLGAFLTVLRGCDGIVFGGGVGEHVPAVRARILAEMSWAGVEVDARANEAAVGQDARIDAAGSAVRVHALAVDEEGVLVRAALSVLNPL